MRNICLCWSIPGPVRRIADLDGPTAADTNHADQTGPVEGLEMGRLSVMRCKGQPSQRLGFETPHRFQSLCFCSVTLLKCNSVSRPLSNHNCRRIPNHLSNRKRNTMNIQISFKPDGTAQCLWTEALPLHELGRLEIHRATNIEFNNTTQQWNRRLFCPLRQLYPPLLFHPVLYTHFTP